MEPPAEELVGNISFSSNKIVSVWHFQGAVRLLISALDGSVADRTLNSYPEDKGEYRYCDKQGEIHNLSIEEVLHELLEEEPDEDSYPFLYALAASDPAAAFFDLTYDAFCKRDWWWLSGCPIDDNLIGCYKLILNMKKIDTPKDKALYVHAQNVLITRRRAEKAALREKKEG
jgi:hypothetical protein|tara:strand:+ start:3669 stop:4187 length:519 start_codon:yes stop_codon:yes gene_type:complete